MTIKGKLLSLNGEAVAVGLKPIAKRGRAFKPGIQLWGVLKVRAYPFYAILKTFQGNSYSLDPEAIDFIAKLKCDPSEVKY